MPEPPPLAFTAAARPRREVLDGRLVRLEPLAPHHAPELVEAAHAHGGDPDLFTYMPYGPFTDRPAYEAHMEGLIASEDPLFWAIVDRASGRAAGHAALLRITPEHGVIEIGHILVTPLLQRTPQATEMLALFGRYVFETLGFRRFEWKCDARNARSRRAAERFGFTFEGIFRQHMVVKGRNRDTAWFALLDGEWPRARAAFGAWLDPSNFDAEGRQRRTLEQVRAIPEP